MAQITFRFEGLTGRLVRESLYRFPAAKLPHPAIPMAKLRTSPVQMIFMMCLTDLFMDRGIHIDDHGLFRQRSVLHLS